MDLPQGTLPLHLSDKVDDNNIGATGCKYLSQTEMRNFQFISLGTFVENGLEQCGGVGLQIPQQS